MPSPRKTSTPSPAAAPLQQPVLSRADATALETGGVAPLATRTAGHLLREALTTIEARAAARDTHSSQAEGQPATRSMLAAVNAFNALHGTALTERQGWMFMVLLKASRANAGALNGTDNPDDYLDGAAYMALAGESVGFLQEPHV